MEVGAGVIVGWHTEHCPGWLTLDQNDAFVSLSDLRHILLGHQQLRAVRGASLEDHPCVAVVGGDVEDAAAAGTVERLDDHLAAEFLTKRH